MQTSGLEECVTDHGGVLAHRMKRNIQTASKGPKEFVGGNDAGARRQQMGGWNCLKERSGFSTMACRRKDVTGLNMGNSDFMLGQGKYGRRDGVRPWR